MAVFVEWPLASNVQSASELAELASGNVSPTVVAIQARVAPAVVKVRELIESGAIGKVLSSEVNGHSALGSRDEISEGLSYFLYKKVGGNPVTIQYGHMSDFIHFVLGKYQEEDGRTQLPHPRYTMNSRDGSKRPATSDVPDLASQHEISKPSLYVAVGAMLIMTFHTGPPFPGDQSFAGTINDEKGEIRMTSEQGPWLSVSSSGAPTPIHVHNYATGEVEEVKWG